MLKEYEVWDDPIEGGVTLSTPENIKTMRAQGLLSRDAQLIYKIEAHTWEEASAVHNLRMGFGAYIPSGEPRPCPNQCGMMFYPEGSGECPNCGKIC